MQMLRAGASKSSKSKVKLLIPLQHVRAMKVRYNIGIGEIVGGMLMITIARKNVREAKVMFDACEMKTDIVVLSEVRRSRKEMPSAWKKVAYL